MNNKKVGIISLYHHNYNYGGLLQSYALCKTLNDLGYNTKQISYILGSGRSEYQKELIKSVKKFIKCFVKGSYFRNMVKREKLLTKFELFIPHTKEVDANNVSKMNNEFDAFVCGSDQVWNPLWWEDAYFLKFASKDKEKISYAASMANDHLSDEEAKYMIDSIKTFKAISLREESSIPLLKSFDDSLDLCVMPDPTLLLSKDEWNKLTVDNKHGSNYIFAYFLGLNFSQRDEAIEYAKKNNKKIYFIDYLKYEDKDWCNKHKEYMIDNVGVPDFLTLIKNADLVITDSFHGAVFSSMFGTPYVVLNRFKSNDKVSMNSRITTLMKILNTDRNVDNLDMNNDYSYTEDELKSIRDALSYQSNKGKSFLKKSLEL